MLFLHGDELPRERLRARLETELGRPVVLEPELSGRTVSDAVTVTYRRERSELAVTWDSKGHTISRVIEAPPELDALIESSAFLSGNLARTQTEEIVPEPVPEPAPVLVQPAVVSAARVPPPAEPVHPERLPITASVFYPLSTHFGRPEVTSNFDLNLVYGRVGSIEGGQLGAINVVTRSRGSASTSMRGIQIAALANVVTGAVSGLQAAALLNVTTGDATGLQASLGVNHVAGAFHGLQSSLLLNRVGRITGAQVAPINLAGDVDGVQIGLVNVARNVRGVSIGLVNVADDIDGVPLAPISVTKTGGVHPTLWSGSSGLGNAGVKFATRRTYTLFFGSYHVAFEREFVGGGLAIGGRIELGSRFHADIDVAGTYLIAPDGSFDSASRRGYHEQLVQPRVRLLLGARAARHFGVFIGGAALGQIRSELDWDRVSAAVGPEILGGVEL